MGTKLVHAADLHIDSPLRGLSRYEGAPVAELRSATRRALTNLVELCLEEDAKLLLIAGDLYDGEWRDYSTGLFLSAELARLREIACEVVWIRGNHDAQSRLTKHITLGPHVHELGVKRPETRCFESLGIAVHGQGFATAAVTEDLSAVYPAPLSGLINIGLLHTALSGRPGHAPYAPCDLGLLKNKGYDYWALGHVHAREVVCEVPWIVFPGNLQGRHIKEQGEKGASLLHVEHGSVARVEHRVLDVVRFSQQAVDVSRAHGVDDVLELCRKAIAKAATDAGPRLCALRLQLEGRSHAHAELSRDPERLLANVQALGNEQSSCDVWIEDVVLGTSLPLDLVALSQRDDALGQVVRALDSLHEEPTRLAELDSELRELFALLPHELSRGELGLELDDPAQAQSLIEAVQQLLLPRLLGGP
jgi:DNA repair exonuclease SbcCD nuclease subunit